jgi:hypothetical protein
MYMINNLVGTPDVAFIQKIQDEDNKKFMMQLPKKKGLDFAELFKDADKDAIDLLKKML